MGITVRALSVMEQAVPVKAVLNNQPNRLPEGVFISGISDVEWSDGSVSQGVKHPGCVYYIDTGDYKIVVDTGAGDIELLSAFRRKRGDVFYLRDEPHWRLEAQLGRLGVSPDEIDIVINTHLHWDHIGGYTLFKHAKFYIQKDEIPYGLGTPAYAPHYYSSMRSCVTDIADRIVVVDGHSHIADGVELWKLGGHTPGSQAVAVRTDKGTVALAADVIPKYENWNYSWPGPAGNFWSLAELVQAQEWLMRNADIVIPGHDWKVWDLYPDGIIAA